MQGHTSSLGTYTMSLSGRLTFYLYLVCLTILFGGLEGGRRKPGILECSLSPTSWEAEAKGDFQLSLRQAWER